MKSLFFGQNYLLYIVIPFKALCPFHQKFLDQQKKSQLCQENGCGYDGLKASLCVYMCVYVPVYAHVHTYPTVYVCVNVCLCV